MEKLHNLRDRICDYENLMSAYRSAARGKRDRMEVIAFEQNLAENIQTIRNELMNMTYTVGNYREFYVRFPKPRLVMALAFKDRVVQWAIYRQINPFLEKRYISHSYGCRKGKGTLKAIQKFSSWQQAVSRKQGDWYVIKGDISKYFYRVDHKVALSLYAEITDDEWFMWLIGSVINDPNVPFGLPEGMNPRECPRDERLYEVGMPIGNLTSQETANLYLNKLDQFCKMKLRLHYYIRYMDDFCIFIEGKKNARKILTRIKDFLGAELKLQLSSKSRIQKAKDPVEFVGYLSTPHGFRIRRKTTTHIKRSLRHIAREHAAGNITRERALQTGACYMGMCRHGNSYNMKRWISENFTL